MNYKLEYVKKDDLTFLHIENFRKHLDLQIRMDKLMENDDVILLWENQNLRKGYGRVY